MILVAKRGFCHPRTVWLAAELDDEDNVSALPQRNTHADPLWAIATA